jgi:hypothetical protein
MLDVFGRQKIYLSRCHKLGMGLAVLRGLWLCCRGAWLEGWAVHQKQNCSAEVFVTSS